MGKEVYKINRSDFNSILTQIDKKIDDFNVEPDLIKDLGEVTACESALTDYKNALTDMQNVLRDYRLLLIMDIELIKKSKEQLEKLDEDIASDYTAID